MNRFIFLDLETTGLDPNTCCILEVGISVYDADNLLTPIAERSWLVHPVEVLPIDDFDYVSVDCACEWWDLFGECHDVVRNMHVRNGLAQEISEALDLGMDADEIHEVVEVEAQAKEFVAEHSQGQRLPMCGKSLHSLDRPFLRKFMPMLDGAFNHRNLDVSQLVMLHKMGWLGDFELEPLRVGTAHRALDDNHEAALLLDGYRKRLGMLRAMDDYFERISLETCSDEDPCMDTSACPRCETFPDGMGG